MDTDHKPVDSSTELDTTSTDNDNTAGVRVDETQEKTSHPQKQRVPISKTAVLSLLISASMLGALGGAGWYVHKNHWTTVTSLSSGDVANQRWVDGQIQTQVSGIAASLKDQIGRSESALTAKLETQLSAQQSSSNARAEGLEKALVEIRTQSSYSAERIDNLSSQLQALKGTDRNVWLLSEAEYLMRLANQRLITMHDLKSARSLLIQAESLLTSIDEYGLINVRQALANDIAALRGTHSIDPTNTWLTLNTLANQIDTLPIINVKSSNFTPANNPPPPEDTITVKLSTDKEMPTLPDTTGMTTQEAVLANIESSLKAAGQKISVFAADVSNKFMSQFLIRKDREHVGPIMMSPDQELFVRQNLRLMIEQAQLTLLQGREEIYQSSMKDIKAWLDKWFVADAIEVEAFRQTLTPLLNTPVTQTIPDITSSLNKLKIYVSEKISSAANRG